MKKWNTIQSLYLWERENLPNGGSLESREVFIWLLALEQKGRPLKDLYSRVISSEPTMRKCILSFEQAGFVKLEGNSSDKRSRLVFATSKLERLASDYINQIRLLAQVELQNAQIVIENKNHLKTGA